MSSLIGNGLTLKIKGFDSEHLYICIFKSVNNAVQPFQMLFTRHHKQCQTMYAIHAKVVP